MKYNIHTIPSSYPFAGKLAEWLVETTGQDALGLSRAVVLLPSRRACVSLKEALLRHSGGKALLLPRMQPLGDVDDDGVLSLGMTTPDMPAEQNFAFRRLFVLARLVHRYRTEVMGMLERFDHALVLAQDLAHLLDQCERERVPLENLQSIEASQFAEHWQLTANFLAILSEQWPHIAREQELISPQVAREAWVAALCRKWEAAPPEYPVIVAGTTGSIPATAKLMQAVAALPRGAIVLPGLDTRADDAYFNALDEGHPQWGMRQLLNDLKCPRDEVHVIGESGSEREKLLSEVMRPAATSAAWQNIVIDKDNALQGMTLVTCVHTQEEATVIALTLREALETPGKTAALVTHDRGLATRVVAIMHRFGVTIDDSAGRPLAQTPAATFLRLLLEVMQNGLDPVKLLALLKHPLCYAGMERAAALGAARAIEMLCLRDVCAPADLPTLMTLLKSNQSQSETLPLAQNLLDITAPFAALFVSRDAVTIEMMTDAHALCAQALSSTSLWEGPEGDALGSFMTDLRDSSADAGPMAAAQYASVFETMLHTRTFRLAYGMHPRLKILSPTEARMQSFDRIVLGGLNEGSWPPQPGQDPWFSREMRKQLGLTMPERQLGLAAHDFYMLASAREVFLCRARKTDNSPAAPARWLVKLDVLLTRLGAQGHCDDKRWRGWANSLDTPSNVRPATRPQPKPPVSARPRKLSVTQIETWQRDPYSIYAAHILRLRSIKELGRVPGNAEFGIAVHAALEQFVLACPGELSVNAREMILEAGQRAFGPLLANPALQALWWPRFTRIADWVVEQERARRSGPVSVTAEAEGSHVIGGFTLTGKADRLERRASGLTIVDYKTGTPPTSRQIEGGLSSQMVLLGLVFASDERTPGLEYWHLRSVHGTATIQALKDGEVEAYMQAAEEGLKRLIKTYANPDFPYYATPVSARAGKYNDYTHLARMKEWG